MAKAIGFLTSDGETYPIIDRVKFDFMDIVSINQLIEQLQYAQKKGVGYLQFDTSNDMGAEMTMLGHIYEKSK